MNTTGRGRDYIFDKVRLNELGSVLRLTEREINDCPTNLPPVPLTSETPPTSLLFSSFEGLYTKSVNLEDDTSHNTSEREIERDDTYERLYFLREIG